MNFWPTMQKMLSPDEAGKSAPTPDAARAASALKPLPEDALIIIPMRNAVLFPGIMSPVTIGRPSSVAAAQEAARSERRVGFLLQRDPEKNELTPNDLHWVGTAGQVVRYITGAKALTTSDPGQSRFRVLESSKAGRHGGTSVDSRISEEPVPIRGAFHAIEGARGRGHQLLANVPDELGAWCSP